MMNESAVIPIETIRPVTPAIVSRKPWDQPNSVIAAYVMAAAMTNELTVTSPSALYWNSEYMTTRIRPMRPASRPRWSWSPPSVGLMSYRNGMVNEMGRAPNLSWSARTLELAAVKLPVILALPAHSAVCGTGSVITRLSSTTAERLRGAGSEMMREVWSQNALLPAELRESRTSQTPLEPPES